MNETEVVMNSKNTIREVNEWLKENMESNSYFITVADDGTYAGILKRADLCADTVDGGSILGSVIAPVKTFLKNDDTLRTAVEEMAMHDTEALSVISTRGDKIIGILTCQGILAAYKNNLEENETANTQISLKRRRMKMLIRGRRLVSINDVPK